MIILTHLSVRGIFITSILLIGLTIPFIIANSKTKNEYNYKTGKIEYLADNYKSYPKRHKGDFRYLIINSYQYPFEIYLPNAVKSQNNLDNLSIGDNIKIYYYENKSTHESRINKFAQFVDKENIPFFIRGAFQKDLGYFIIGLIMVLNLISFILWKKNKLKW